MNTNIIEAYTTSINEPRSISKILIGNFIIILSWLMMINFGKIFHFNQEYDYIFTILFWIGFFIQFIPLGYSISSAHNCIQNELLILPEWKNIGEYLSIGLISTVIIFIYFLPFYILSFLGVLSILYLHTSPQLVYILLFLLLCAEIIFIFAVSMFYFKDMKISDAFRIKDIFTIFFKHLKTLFLIFLNIIAILIITTIISILVGITIVGILLIPSIFIVGALAALYIISKEGREILWNENMWGTKE